VTSRAALGLLASHDVGVASIYLVLSEHKIPKRMDTNGCSLYFKSSWLFSKIRQSASEKQYFRHHLPHTNNFLSCLHNANGVIQSNFGHCLSYRTCILLGTREIYRPHWDRDLVVGKCLLLRRDLCSLFNFSSVIFINTNMSVAIPPSLLSIATFRSEKALVCKS